MAFGVRPSSVCMYELPLVADMIRINLEACWKSNKIKSTKKETHTNQGTNTASSCSKHITGNHDENKENMNNNHSSSSTNYWESISTFGDSQQEEGSSSRWECDEVPPFPGPLCATFSPRCPRRQSTDEGAYNSIIDMMIHDDDDVNDAALPSKIESTVSADTICTQQQQAVSRASPHKRMNIVANYGGADNLARLIRMRDRIQSKRWPKSPLAKLDAEEGLAKKGPKRPKSDPLRGMKRTKSIWSYQDPVCTRLLAKQIVL